MNRGFKDFLCKHSVKYALEAIAQPSTPIYQKGVLWLLGELVDNGWSSGFTLRKIPGKDYFDELTVSIRENSPGKFEMRVHTNKENSQSYYLEMEVAPETSFNYGQFYMDLYSVTDGRKDQLDSACGTDGNRKLYFYSMVAQQIASEILTALIDFVQGDHEIRETPRNSYILEKE